MLKNVWTGMRKGKSSMDKSYVEQSHVSDLLKDAIFSCLKNFRPQGYESFYEHLTAVPLSLIKNHSRIGLVGKGRSKDQTGPPPPGLPIHDQEARPLRSTIE